MKKKYAKKFLIGIWVAMLSLLIGFLLAVHFDNKDKEFKLEGSTENTETSSLAEKYTKEDIDEWERDVDEMRETGYQSFQYTLQLSEADMPQVDQSLYEYVDYSNEGDNSEVLGKTVYALAGYFGGNISDYIFFDIKYDETLMQGIYIIICNDIQYDVAISETENIIYVNQSIVDTSVNDTEIVMDATEEMILVEE